MGFEWLVVEVVAVSVFYEDAKMAKPRKLYVCTEGKKCPKRGGKQVFAELQAQAEALGNDDIKVKETGCLKLCKHGPAALSMPDKIPYGRLDVQNCRLILDAHAKGERHDKLTVKGKAKKK